MDMECHAMLFYSSRITTILVLFALTVFCAAPTSSQEQPPPQPETPKGVEVLARGPVHEAFASPTAESKAAPMLAKKPPLPIEEMPPEERPEGDVVWIGGYWSWDDDRNDFLWVSGCWRVKPEGKEWVPGYWREVGTNWQWVAGFWTQSQEQRGQGVTYYPEPPAAPNVAPPGEPPGQDMFHVPGYWMWSGDRYVWRAGYWTRVRPGHVYVASHYRWTPHGYVFVAGYWDYAVSRRGVLYAPVVVDTVVVGPRFVYTPYYAVRDTVVLDSLFVRVSFGSYYFGDYYGARYAAIGFEPCVFYSRRHYEPIIVYERWVYRETPRWHETRISLVIERNAGRAPVPPRTLVQQNNTIIQNKVTNITNVNNVTNVTNVTNVIAPTKTVVAARGEKSVPLDNTTRAQVRDVSQNAQQTVIAERKKAEASPSSSGSPVTKPRTAAITVPSSPPVTSAGKGTPLVNPVGGTKGQPMPITTIPPATKGIDGKSTLPGESKGLPIKPIGSDKSLPKDPPKSSLPPPRDGSKVTPPPPPRDGSKVPPPPRDKVAPPPPPPPPKVENPPRDGNPIVRPPINSKKTAEPKKKGP